MPTAITSGWCILLGSKLNLRQLVLFAMLGALTFAAKMVMAPLPNIEPVSLFVMLFAVTFGKKCLYPIYVYVAMELIHGIDLWTVNYLYIWAILALAAYLLKGMKSPWGWAILSGSFGLLFGFLCTPVYLVTSGLYGAFVWWSNGILFDLLHCAGNFVIALILFVPLRNLLGKLYRNLQ